MKQQILTSKFKKNFKAKQAVRQTRKLKLIPKEQCI